MRSRYALAALTLTLTLLVPEARAWEPPADEPAPKHALLVGVTRYDHLPDCDLQGPANDVVLMRSLLVDQFGITPENIVTLSEDAAAQDARWRPTRGNIARELEALAGRVSEGHEVVIFLAGHGVQQLADDDDLEVDGLDEVFLPADAAAPADGTNLKNVIVDDHLRGWLDDIRQAGASMLVVVDACHSGTIIRGAGETPRKVPPEKLFSPAVTDQIHQRQAKAWRAAQPGVLVPIEQADYLQRTAVLYAARSNEPTVELPMPGLEPGSKQDTYGLFTYTLCKVLRQTAAGRPMTYRELVRCIEREYAAMGRLWPIPLVEGLDRDKDVLGRAPGRQSPYFELARTADGLRLRAGSLHGLTESSKLAVYPPIGAVEEERRLGHVEIRRLRALDADVAPSGFDDHGKTWPKVADLPDGGRCELVYQDFGDLRLKLALEIAPPADRASTTDQESTADSALLLRQVQELASQKDCPVDLVEDPAAADWRIRAEGERVYLVHRGGTVEESVRSRAAQIGPVPAERLAAELAGPLRQVARAEMLKRLAARIGNTDALEIKVEVVRYRDESDREGEPHQNSAGSVLHEGDVVGFRVTNGSRNALAYVTLLFLDSGYGIHPLYPGPGEVAERLAPKSSFTTPRLRVNAETTGTEYVIAVGVKAVGAPVDFAWLAQPTLEMARDAQLQQRGAQVHTLDRLFENATFAAGGVRGLGGEQAADCCMDLISWETRPKAAP